MSDSAPAKTNVFQFMVIRAPNSIEPKVSQRGYITDDDDLFSAQSTSRIGPMIYQKVFCEDPPEHPEHGFPPLPPNPIGIIRALLETLPFIEPACPNPAVMGSIEALRDRTYITASGRLFYILPDRLEHLQAPLIALLGAVLDVLHAPPLMLDKTLDINALRKKLISIFDGRLLHDVVFSRDEVYVEEFAAARRELFDTLYKLYILRRRVSINLEHIIEGLRALHVLEALAVEPSLIGDLDDLKTYLSATPIIHPLFARLHRFREPFNTIRPLGIGDLKVVKQWLCGYKAGDFAHVENVLEGESKIRVHRRLEKTEELFSFSSEKQEETQHDLQSTDRFELKREAESVIKQDLAVNLNATVTYSSMPIVATVTAGMSYTRSQTDQNKSADNFSREVLDKAVKRIQSRASEQRSTTKLFETEETNTHTLANPAGKGHISGIYRWLDKEYRAQLYNYGKRLMFEFILPEPAAFFVEARLRAYEGQIDVPKPPQVVKPQVAVLDFAANAIDQVKFNNLRLHYDLTDLSYPVQTKTVEFKDSTTGQAYFEGGGPTPLIMQPVTYACDLNSIGYNITSLAVEGTLQFSSMGTAGTTPAEKLYQNLLSISIDGTPVFSQNYVAVLWHSFHKPNVDDPHDETLHNKTTPYYHLTADRVDLVINGQNIQHSRLEVSAFLTYSKEALAEWQQYVYERVYKAEQDRLDKLYQEAAQAYQAQMATYHNRLAELRTMAVNELLQGQSDAFNRQLIGTELKRLCLAMLTKDFDASTADDVMTKLDAMGERQESFTYRQLEVKELPDAIAPTSVEVQFAIRDKTIGYPAPKLGEAAFKARYIQFLEQAFDWQQMAYLFYPYFWATPPKWIELMSRSDAGDANMSAFLQAGSCKVLLAVSPAYDDSVMHYLATGEPWEGGPAPVIGDPLYLPLYEEVRKQQDDLDGAKPEGKSWKFTVPTSLVYLENSSTPLPKSVCAETT
jgi:hypothetical protein